MTIVAHGGRLWAEANTPRGARVMFTLPGDRDLRRHRDESFVTLWPQLIKDLRLTVQS